VQLSSDLVSISIAGLPTVSLKVTPTPARPLKGAGEKPEMGWLRARSHTTSPFQEFFYLFRRKVARGDGEKVNFKKAVALWAECLQSRTFNPISYRAPLLGG
jgi:hypothetical protein